ncbi:VTCN1 inhibitor, partial [Pedionomus torquatus]|nr:VTCN1 inhibitor [Pedionomus torquatus]
GQPDTTCHAFVGETVILPCTTTSPGELILSNSILYWQIEHTVVVHFFYKGQDMLDEQEERYYGRTSLFLDQMKHGNFSLKLSNVQLLDTAEYTCIYKQTGDHPNKTQKSKINLILHANLLFFNFSGHSQIPSRSLADVPFLAMLPLSFHLLVSLGVWHL